MNFRWALSTCSAICFVLIILVGCSSSESSTGGGQSLKLDAEEIDLLIQDAPAEQQEAIEDGVVTTAERERAYLAFLSCMESQGLRTVRYELNVHGGDQIEQDSGSLSPEQVDNITRSCRSTYYTVVGVVYEYSNRRTVAEEAEHLERIAECLRGNGVEVPNAADLDEMTAIDRGLTSECIAANR